MEQFPCVNKADCRYAGTNQGCVESVHHIFFPSTDYKDALSHAFRNLDQNKELMCRQLHDIVHRVEQPPIKPDRETMLEAVTTAVDEGTLILSATRRRKIYGKE